MSVLGEVWKDYPKECYDRGFRDGLAELNSKLAASEAAREKAEAACAELREAYESYKSTCRESRSQENILMAQAGLFAVLDESLKGGEE